MAAETERGGLNKISPDNLDELFVRVRDEGHTELVLVRPNWDLCPSDSNWPSCLKGKTVFKLTHKDPAIVQKLIIAQRKVIGQEQIQELSLLDLGVDEVGAKWIAETLTQLTSLNLFNNNIGNTGAKAIAESLTQLTSLNLSNNGVGNAGIMVIAENLTQLTSLNLSYNDIRDRGAMLIAENLKQLTSLKLYRSINPIDDFGAIGNFGAMAIAENLTRLTSLNLGFNGVGNEGTKAIAQNLTKLTSLNLRGDEYDHIGDEGAKSIAENLNQLTSLDLCENHIGDEGVRSIAENLNQLTSLSLGHNRVGNSGVSSIGEHLSRLTYLELYSNSGVTDLAPLKDLICRGLTVNYQGCPLVHPSAEVVAQGPEAVANYFREIDAQGVDQIYEAKVLILGEGGAGKTSLLRRLYQSGPLPTEDETTRGIDIHCEEFTRPDGRTFRLNVWDFGGQQIYHATHQFFLTKSSLYVLVDDTRKDHKSTHDDGFKYWLEVVEVLSDSSPLLIFQNEKGGRTKTIDEAGIKGRFSNVKDTYRGDLEKVHAANDLKDAIEYFTQRLPHVGKDVPAKWVSIRADVETVSKEKPYISQDDYFEIYSRHLEFDRKKALHLSQFMHDLGVFLHFQDDLRLCKTVILQNEWATMAVFRILDDEEVKGQLGRFTLADCGRLWNNAEFADMHHELLAMMEKFELCYRLADTTEETWLAPQLLSPSKPASLSDWSQPTDLVLSYRYDFLPKGLVSRLMVRMHRFVRQPDLCWETGALFEHEDTIVLVEATARGNEIVLRGRGPESKALVSVIASSLDALNASFHGLDDKVGKWVPCICDRCAGSTSPELFEQRRLLQRKRDNKATIECPESYEDVGVLELLEGLKLDQLPMWAEDPDSLHAPPVESAPQLNVKTIKIFLASSEELREDRDAFDLYFRQQNDRLRKQGLYLEIVRWENFLDAMSETRLQDEYNRKVRDCDIFVSLFKTKTGKFTEEEFDVAHQAFQECGKPLLYTFFRDAEVSTDASNKDALMSLWNFKEKLQKLGHFSTQYKDQEDLKLQFKDQLEQLQDRGEL